MTHKASIELFDQDIDVELGYCIENDSMDYEWWGYKESIKGEDYPTIESITWDESLFTQEQNKLIEDHVWDEKQLNEFENIIIEHLKNY